MSPGIPPETMLVPVGRPWFHHLDRRKTMPSSEPGRCSWKSKRPGNDATDGSVEPRYSVRKPDDWRTDEPSVEGI